MIVPGLVLRCGFSMPEAIATSLLVIVLNSFSGFAGSIAHVTLDFRVAALVTTASVIGSSGGAFAAGRAPPEIMLRRAFAWLALVMAAFTLWRQTSGFWGLAAVLAAVVGAWIIRRPTAAASNNSTRKRRTQLEDGRLLWAGDSS